jgi:hypothetical protein
MVIGKILTMRQAQQKKWGPTICHQTVLRSGFALALLDTFVGFVETNSERTTGFRVLIFSIFVSITLR